MYKDTEKLMKQFLDDNTEKLSKRANAFGDLMQIAYNDNINESCKTDLLTKIAGSFSDDEIEEGLLLVTPTELRQLIDAMSANVEMIDCPLKIDEEIYYINECNGTKSVVNCKVKLIRHIQINNADKPSFEALISSSDGKTKLHGATPNKTANIFIGDPDTSVWINRNMYNKDWFFSKSKAKESIE